MSPTFGWGDIISLEIFDDFAFSTKGSIEVISVGMERSYGIPMEIFCLHLMMKRSTTYHYQLQNLKILLSLRYLDGSLWHCMAQSGDSGSFHHPVKSEELPSTAAGFLPCPCCDLRIFLLHGNNHYHSCSMTTNYIF